MKSNEKRIKSKEKIIICKDKIIIVRVGEKKSQEECTKSQTKSTKLIF
jgi:hypothetical protein